MKQSKKVVCLRQAEDGYRGDMSCVNILTPHEEKLIEDNEGQGDVYDVVDKTNGEVLGLLTRWYGNNGQGKLAAEKFCAKEGVEEQWEEDRVYNPNEEDETPVPGTKVQVSRAPDEYRGDYSCVYIETLHEEVLKVDKHGQGDEYAVKVDGVVVGKLTRWYGNNGQGKLAAEKFEPRVGVEVEWVEEENE